MNQHCSISKDRGLHSAGNGILQLQMQPRHVPRPSLRRVTLAVTLAPAAQDSLRRTVVCYKVQVASVAVAHYHLDAVLARIGR